MGRRARWASRAAIILCFLAGASGVSYQIRFEEGARQQVGCAMEGRARV